MAGRKALTVTARGFGPGRSHPDRGGNSITPFSGREVLRTRAASPTGRVFLGGVAPQNRLFPRLTQRGATVLTHLFRSQDLGGRFPQTRSQTAEPRRMSSWEKLQFRMTIKNRPELQSHEGRAPFCLGSVPIIPEENLGTSTGNPNVGCDRGQVRGARAPIIQWENGPGRFKAGQLLFAVQGGGRAPTSGHSRELAEGETGEAANPDPDRVFGRKSHGGLQCGFLHPGA